MDIVLVKVWPKAMLTHGHPKCKKSLLDEAWVGSFKYAIALVYVSE